MEITILTIITYLQNLFLPLFQRFIKLRPELQNWYNPDESKFKETIKDQDRPIPPEKKRRLGIGFSSPTYQNIPFVTSPYGYRILKIKGQTTKKVFHYGTDLAAPHGSRANATEDCVITEIVKINVKAPNRFKKDLKTGEYIDLRNGSITPRVEMQGVHTGNIYVYKHCKAKTTLRVNQKFKHGSKVGTFGNYGYSLGSHDHLEVYLYKHKIWASIRKTKGKHALVNPRVWLEKKAGIKCTGRKRKVWADENLHEIAA